MVTRSRNLLDCDNSIIFIIIMDSLNQENLLEMLYKSAPLLCFKGLFTSSESERESEKDQRTKIGGGGVTSKDVFHWRSKFFHFSAVFGKT